MVYRGGAQIEGPNSLLSEKFYLKSVSPEEIAKMEYEDHVQLFTTVFERNNYENMTNFRLFNKTALS
jgi:hypothetical protein